MSTVRGVAAALALSLMAVPAAAQFSDSYTFLKAVRDKDGSKAQTLANEPGTTVVNVRDPGTGETPLHIVVRRSDLAWLGFLLSKGADPNVRDRAGETPLTLAATTGFTEGARVLLQVRAKPDFANGRGETPLIKAVQARNAEMVRLLLNAGANPDQTDNAAGYSARDYAQQDRRGGVIAKLIAESKSGGAATSMGPSR